MSARGCGPGSGNWIPLRWGQLWAYLPQSIASKVPVTFSVVNALTVFVTVPSQLLISTSIGVVSNVSVWPFRTFTAFTVTFRRIPWSLSHSYFMSWLKLRQVRHSLWLYGPHFSQLRELYSERGSLFVRLLVCQSCVISLLVGHQIHEGIIVLNS